MARRKLTPPTSRRRPGRGGRQVNFGWWGTIGTVVVLGVVGVVVSRGTTGGADIVRNLTMPDLGAAEQVSLTSAAVEPYDRVKEGDVIFEINAGDRKSTVKSPIDGFFVEQLVAPGETVTPGTRIGTVQTGVDFNTANAAGWHWHAAYGVNICGSWLGPLGETQTDIHTHGDGLLHMEARSTSGAGKNSTLGKVFDILGAEVRSNRLRYLGETYRPDEVKCGEGKDALDAEFRWALNGKEQRGNPANVLVGNGDVIVLAFIGPDDELMTLAPSTASLGSQGSPVKHPDYAPPPEGEPGAAPHEDPPGTPPHTHDEDAGGGSQGS